MRIHFNLAIGSFLLFLGVASGAFGRPTPGGSAKTLDSVKMGEIHVAMASDCRIVFTNKANKKAQWSLPLKGPCYFAKETGGKKIKVYQSKIDKTKPMLILGHSSSNVNGQCEGMSVGILVNEGRVLVAVPPFANFATCVGPTGGFDEKNFADAWATMLTYQKYEEVKFPSN